MKGKVYRVKVIGGVADYASAVTHDAVECFVPRLNLAFNLYEGDLHVFRPRRELRYRDAAFLREVDVSWALVDALRDRMSSDKTIRILGGPLLQ